MVTLALLLFVLGRGCSNSAGREMTGQGVELQEIAPRAGSVRGNWGLELTWHPFRMRFTGVSLIMIGWHLWMYFYISSFPIKMESVRTLGYALEWAGCKIARLSVLRPRPLSRNNEMNLGSHACVAVGRGKNGAAMLEGLPATNFALRRIVLVQVSINTRCTDLKRREENVVKSSKLNQTRVFAGRTAHQVGYFKPRQKPLTRPENKPS